MSNIDCVSIFADEREKLNTLEPQFIDANKDALENLCEAIGIKYSKYDAVEKINKYMIGNKTKWALKIFESDKSFKYPQYLKDAVGWCNE
jgi:putative ATP-dependent endonuclease of OLD family